MKITAVTAPAAASDPTHPDHDRWVKDVTLAREMEWAKTVGIPTRVAEAENQRLLELSAKQARDAAPAAPKVKKPPAAVDSSGVTRRTVDQIAVQKAPPCGYCTKCRVCKRASRTMAIVHRRKESASLDALALRMFVAALQASAGIGKFKHLSRRDVDRALTVEMEAICDASIRYLGAWL